LHAVNFWLEFKGKWGNIMGISWGYDEDMMGILSIPTGELT